MSNHFPVIKTKRLVLREIVDEDASDILKYLSDKEVMKHYGLEPFTTVEDALNEIAWYKSILNKRSGIRWGITLKEQGDIIGSCGFLNRVHNHYRTGIGYELARDYWGNGIASEALGAVIKYGFTNYNLRRIEALIETANVASRKLIKKHGFVEECLLRSYEFTCGKFDDLYMYSLLKQDFEKLQIKFNIICYHPQFAEQTVKMWRDSKEKAIEQKEIHSFERHVYFLNHILSAHYKIELALVDEQIVGMVAYNADEISQLYVHVDYQGGGIGQRLLERAKTESKGKLTLRTFERNKNAQRFYEKHGFSIMERGCENEEKLPDITYEWTSK